MPLLYSGEKEKSCKEVSGMSLYVYLVCPYQNADCMLQICILYLCKKASSEDTEQI